MNWMRRAIWPEVITSAIFFASGAGAWGATDRPTHDDCGTLALYSLLRAEGHEVALDDLRRGLPALPRKGYSMKQLRDLARASGLAVEGILWKDQVFAPQEPILAFMKQGDHGHYVVIRPVGRSGKMVQVFDNDQDVKTYDFNEIAAAPEWTGLLLHAPRPNWARRCGVFAGIIGLGLALPLVIRCVRGTPAMPPDRPTPAVG